MGKKSKKKKSTELAPKAVSNSSKPVATGHKTSKGLSVDFYHFIFKDKGNKRLFWGAILISILLFLLFKYCLPLPDIFSDSNSYILAAAKKLDIYYRPVGYSKFLNFLHYFSVSPNFVVWVQYLLLILSGLLAFFSIDYLLHFKNKRIRFLSWILLTVNPIIMLLANEIGSDSLFAALTVIWFVMMLWILQRGKWWLLVAQLLILYWAFTVRYSALYYPIIAVVVFLLSRKKNFAFSFVGIIATLFVIGITYNNIKKKTERQTGANVFAGFSGWQMADNALVLYVHLDSIPSSEFDDPELKLLNKFVNHFVDSIPQESLNKIKAGKLPGGAFLWVSRSPLKQFLFNYCNRYRLPYFPGWYQVSEFYGRFGKQVILNHPGAYLKYYIWPNFKLFFFPMREFMGAYHSNLTIPPTTMHYFPFESNHLTARYPLNQAISFIYPYLNALLACLSILFPILFLIKSKREHHSDWKAKALFPVIFWGLFFLGNAGFSLLASAITLRYMAVWFILYYTMPLWFLDQLIVSKKRPSVEA